MDTSQARGTGDEYSSGESGWTTYLGSPNYEDNKEYRGDKLTNQESRHDDEESDDSMASDASSGPNHYHCVTLHTRGSRGEGDNKYAKDQNLATSGKKPMKQTQKKTYNRKTEAETEEPKRQPHRGYGYSQSGAKKIK